MKLILKKQGIIIIEGVAKLDLGDKQGACLDWSKAGELGYEKAYDAIKEECK